MRLDQVAGALCPDQERDRRITGLGGAGARFMAVEILLQQSDASAHCRCVGQEGARPLVYVRRGHRRGEIDITLQSIALARQRAVEIGRAVVDARQQI